MSDLHCAFIGAVIVIAAFTLGAWKISGQIGYERGASFENYEAAADFQNNRGTMAQLGVCRWAQVYADCSLKDGPKQ
jgi:hypothetical protein